MASSWSGDRRAQSGVQKWECGREMQWATPVVRLGCPGGDQQKCRLWGKGVPPRSE
jgi:hypothetical protein